MGQPETRVGALCRELSVTRQTLYRHVGPKGELRPDGEKLLAGQRRAGGCGAAENRSAASFGRILLLGEDPQGAFC